MKKMTTVLLEEQIADTLEYVLTASKNLVINEITLRPQKNKIKTKKPKKISLSPI